MLQHLTGLTVHSVSKLTHGQLVQRFLANHSAFKDQTDERFHFLDLIIGHTGLNWFSQLRSYDQQISVL